MVEEAFTCLRDTWGGQLVKSFEIQSRKTKIMLLAEFFVHNHLHMIVHVDVGLFQPYSPSWLMTVLPLRQISGSFT